MNKILFFAFSAFAFLSSFSQTQDPVHWATSYKSLSATEGEITINAIIDKGWHTYSQKETEAGPISTTFTFPASTQYKLDGKTEESGAVEVFDKAFEAKIYTFTDKAVFKQKIKLNGKPGFTVPFKVEYTCCNDNRCLPPKTIDLSVKTQ
ncbi:MAG: hypothetical protein JNL60_16045 [Bacteroidia bacterium]|nr:hypothetical protein [Bacteroidia bacterium]